MTDNLLRYHRLIAISAALLLIVGCQSYDNSESLYPSGMQSDSDLAFARASGRAPTAKTLYAMAGALAIQGKDSEAHFTLERLIETYPKYLPAYNDMAELHLRHNRYEEARVVLRAGLELNPNDPILTNNLGMCDLLSGQYEAAIVHFEHASAFDPENVRYQANQALIYGLLGEYDRSLNVYKKVLPEAEAHYNLAICCAARQDYERAAAERTEAKMLGYEGPKPKKK